jgi:transcription elongation factor GreB
MQPRANYITPTGLAALKARYDHLLGTERPETVAVVSWAAGNGDRSENGDYLYGRKRMREIDRELAHLARRMKAAKVVDPARQPDRARVWFGATVTIAPIDDDGSDDNHRTVTLVGDDEQDPKADRIGWSAPIARATRRRGRRPQDRSPAGGREGVGSGCDFLPRGHVSRYPVRMRRVLIAVGLVCLAAPLAAKDSLGVFDDWGAFRDPGVPRCYAIAAADGSQGYADVGTWPRQGVRGQVHFRLSRPLAVTPRLSLSLGGTRYELTGGGVDAWAKDKQADAAIVAAMRSADSLSVTASDSSGRRFTDRYSLKGAATAMDAATVGCARVR